MLDTTTEIAEDAERATAGRRVVQAPAQVEDITRFERTLAQYLAGELAEERFRIFRLNFGIYGQRQGGHNQMVRVKLPGGVATPEQLEALGRVATAYSRGWGHITTRQNIQFHFVDLLRTPELLWELAAAGLTTREACGDTVRNVTACPLAGACPSEVLDVSPWAEAVFRTFLRHPYAQRLPRKFKINLSGCAVDCGQAAFNDLGIVAVARQRADGTTERGFRVLLAGGLGANPHPAQALEPFTPREDLVPTAEAVLRTFDHYGNRDNKIRARMKWLVDTVGIDELRARILKERNLLIASATYAEGLPVEVLAAGDAPAGRATGSPAGTAADTSGDGPLRSAGLANRPVPVTLRRRGAYERWDEANVVRGRANGTVSAVASIRLGDVTAEQFTGLAALVREIGCEVRVTNRQNFVLRALSEDQLPVLHGRLETLGMAKPGAELARDVVSCPGADTCNLAVTQSRGLAAAIGDELEAAGLAEVGGVRINISGCTNSCGQHHVADIGFVGAERRAHGRPAPGYQMLLGGRLGQTQIEFGHRALRLPAKRAALATVAVVGRFAEEREAGEVFADWLERVGGAQGVAAGLKHLDAFPSPEEAPEMYIDYDETGPYVAEVGEGECMGS